MSTTTTMATTTTTTRNLDLVGKTYGVYELVENIYSIDLIDLLKTQKIDEEFAVNYILNNNYQLTDDEEKITMDFIISQQPHLNKEKLLRLFVIGPQDHELGPKFE